MTKTRLSNTIKKTLVRKKITLSCCESCTGGLLGSIITNTPGSSCYFHGGVIAYSDAVKTVLAGVKKSTLKKYGAVSKQVACEMAQNIRKRIRSDIGISITGIAGPGGGTKTKPVGLVYIGFSWKNKTHAKKYIFSGNREKIRVKACQAALSVLRDGLT